MAESAVAIAAQWIGLLLEEANILLRVEEDVRNLQGKLQVLQEYLQDADDRPGQQVRTLTAQVRNLAYESEDLIDTYILKLNPKTELSDRNLLVKSARQVCNSPRTYILGKRIEKLQHDVDEVIKKLDEQQVKRNSYVKETSYPMQRTPKTSYPYDDSAYVVGWEKDMQKLVQVLMGQDEDIRVVAIIGMGGSGKTTMARSLYNHPYVKDCFQCWAWVCVSQEWNPQHLLSEILRQIAGPYSQHDIKPKYVSKEGLVDQIRNILIKKSYLVVRDDVWRKEALEDIIPALAHSKGSKLIITTRNKQIVQLEMSLSSYIHVPCPLDEDQGWKLLSNFALKHRLSTDSNQVDLLSFEQLGKEMLKQCKGLPLAIRTLAGILSKKSSIGEWQKVSSDVRTRVMEGVVTHDIVENILALSYNDLPYYLKPCFLYMGLFPEDCQIPTGMLTRMWAAEGFITPHGNMSMEDIAMYHLEELSHRFLIQVVKTNFKGDIKAVHLHDILRDICLKKAQDQDFLKIYTSTKDLTINDASALEKEPRRAALHSRTTLPTQNSQLRSLVLLTQTSVLRTAYVYKEKLQLVELGVVHRSFELLRVLNLWGIKTACGTLPKEIGKLIHLRYLGIRATNITQLPRTVGRLRYLLTLDYRNIDSDISVPIKIPKELGRLKQLRHLFLPMDCLSTSVEDDLKLDAMSNLQTLWGVQQDDGSRGAPFPWLSREMPLLSTTLKKLRVTVSTEEDLKAVFSSPSLMKLHTLHCRLRDGVTLQKKHVKPLSDHLQLHKLILIGNISMQLSLLLPANLIKLELKDSMLIYEDPMWALGALAHLKHLRLSNFHVGSCFASTLGSFPQLEELYLVNLPNLVSWTIDDGAFPCLKKLAILRCCKLAYFPPGLANVTTLLQLDFYGVPDKFGLEATAYGWSKKGLRLPHNYDAIIEKCDFHVDTSSNDKLYEQLTAGIFLYNKRQKYWVLKQNDCFYNCFMVFAADLTIATKANLDRTSIPKWVSPSEKIPWRLGESGLQSIRITEMAERDGTSIKVIRLYWGIGLLKVRGRLNSAYISPGVTYRISYVIKLLDTSLSREKEMSVISSLRFPDKRYQEYKDELNHKPRNEWIQVLVGEFVTSDEEYGELEFYLEFMPQYSDEIEFAIKGVNIEPKL